MGPNRGRCTRVVVALLLLLLLLQQIGSRGGGIVADRFDGTFGESAATSSSTVRRWRLLLWLLLEVMVVERVQPTKEMLLLVLLNAGCLGLKIIDAVVVVVVLQRGHPVVVAHGTATNAVVVDVVQTAAIADNAVDGVVIVDGVWCETAAAGAPRRRITRLLIAALVLCAVATQVTNLAAAVAALVPGRTVPRNVTTLVAVVARHVQIPIALLRAVAGQVAALVAVVAARVVRRQAALACDVAASVATVASVQVLLAVTCKVAHLVALVALLAASTATAKLTPIAAGSTGTATTAAAAHVLAVAGKMARSVTLEARISRHFAVTLRDCNWIVAGLVPSSSSPTLL